MNEYRLKLPKQHRLFDVDSSDNTTLTFTINHIRSRVPSVIYFILHLYNVEDKEIYWDATQGEVKTLEESESDDTKVAFKSDRCVVGTAFSLEGGDFIYPFDIKKELLDSKSSFFVIFYK